MYLLKSNSVIKLSFSFGFAIRFIFFNLFFLKTKNWSSPKIIVLLIYILIILNGVLVIIIKKYKLNVKVVIKNFSL